MFGVFFSHLHFTEHVGCSACSSSDFLLAFHQIPYSPPPSYSLNAAELSAVPQGRAVVRGAVQFAEDYRGLASERGGQLTCDLVVPNMLPICKNLAICVREHAAAEHEHVRASRRL